MVFRMRALAVGAITCAALLSATASAAASYYIQPSLTAAAAAALLNPSQAPPGVNNYACTLSAAHPRPVVLINGTFANMEDDWGALGPILANDGYCVFSTNFGAQPGAFIQSVGPVAQSAKEVASFVESVRAHYGGTQVDLVGHSQGGLIAEYVTKSLGLAPHVHTLVGLSPSTHGTTLDGLTLLAGFFPGANEAIVGGLCAACYDQEAGSQFLAAFDNPPIAQAGVSYTILETTYEVVVTPVGSSFINESGVKNKYLQSSCWNDTIEHAGMPYDNTTNRLVLNALSPSTAKAPNCWISYPLLWAVQQ
ncbi:MAG TPA: alpha/beta fold hydrolase [Solirubrobacteraceae bacterium]|nr:alpha/beta fold hydrolase [Solirubrobacteraceae bacterium]